MNLLYTILLALVYFVVISLIAGFTTVVERRVAGRMQSRIGPNRVGPYGAIQWLADGIKAIQKEDIIPTDVNRLLFMVSPYLVFTGMFATLVPIPLTMYTVMENLDTGIFYVLAMSSFVVVGLIMAGWSSNNKWSLLGGMRSAAQLISYEIPSGVAVFVIVLMAGSLNLNRIVLEQGASPVDWYVFRTPFTLLSFFVFFIAALAEGNRVPFDIPEAESELVSGYNTEYSGMRFLFFFFAEWANLAVIGALVTTLYFGGWQFWWEYTVSFSLPGLNHPVMVDLLGMLWFFLKVSFFIFVIIWLRWTLPRLRVDQLMGICWQYLIPIGFVASLGTIVWMYFVPQASMADYIMRYVIAIFGGFVVLYFFYRVYKNIKETGGQVHLNQFM